MKINVWGCRGSLPSPDPENYKYGGNTSCVQVTQGDTHIILDGGSGIQRLGKHLGSEIKEIHILLSHLHIDHTMGLGFFLPLYNPDMVVHLWGPSATVEPLLHRLRRYFSAPLFPVRLNELPRHPLIHEVDNSEFEIGGVKIRSTYVCHPGPTLGYRLSSGNSVFAYIPDHELSLGSPNFPNEPDWTSGYEIAKDADLLFHDAEYTAAEYATKIGWGHSSIEDAIEFGKLCRVKKLALFHHDPMNSDFRLENMYQECIRNRVLDFEVELCAEGNSYTLG